MKKEYGEEIRRLRLLGYGYKKIAVEINIPLNTVKTYCRRNLNGVGKGKFFCKECGKVVPQKLHKKERKFCSDLCRVHWWKKIKKYEGSMICVCEKCKKQFFSYPSKKRKFCSNECYHKFARKEGQNG